MTQICDSIAEAPEEALYAFYAERFRGEQCNIDMEAFHEDHMNELMNHVHDDDCIGTTQSLACA
jgi:hypothetical protein